MALLLLWQIQATPQTARVQIIHNAADLVPIWWMCG